MRISAYIVLRIDKVKSVYMKKKCCIIYNYAQHYRTDIFTKVSEEYLCDFVFGDAMGDVKKIEIINNAFASNR